MPRRAANDQRLKAFIEAEAEALLGTLRFYVLRAGLAAGDAIPQAAQELLNEVVVEALDHAGRFRPDGEPKAWSSAARPTWLNASGANPWPPTSRQRTRP